MNESNISKYLSMVEERKFQVKFKEHPICHYILDIQQGLSTDPSEYIHKLGHVSKSTSIQHFATREAEMDKTVYVKITDKSSSQSSEVTSPIMHPSIVGEDAQESDGAMKVEEVEVEVDVCSDGSRACLIDESSTHSTCSEPPSKSADGQFYCNVCYRRFSQQANLIKHERIHTGERPYSCDLCFKTFNQQSNLWKHLKTHSGEKPYQCEVCQKAFTQQANLMKHIRVHTGERPYSCVVCNKAFAQRVNLLKHERTHTGEKPYHCAYCSKAFAQQSNLVKHERIHTGVKPFLCKICCKAFTQQSNLTKHEAVHTKEKPFTCKTCDKSYTQKSNLQKHQKKCPPFTIRYVRRLSPKQNEEVKKD